MRTRSGEGLGGLAGALTVAQVLALVVLVACGEPSPKVAVGDPEASPAGGPDGSRPGAGGSPKPPQLAEAPRLDVPVPRRTASWRSGVESRVRLLGRGPRPGTFYAAARDEDGAQGHLYLFDVKGPAAPAPLFDGRPLVLVTPLSDQRWWVRDVGDRRAPVDEIADASGDRWELDLGQSLSPLVEGGAIAGERLEPTWLGGGVVTTVLGEENGSRVAWVDTGDGRVLHQESVGGWGSGGVADERGALYLLTTGHGAAALWAFSPEGARRWTGHHPIHPVAVYGGTLFTDDGSVLDTETGALRYSYVPGKWVLLTEAHAFVVSGCGIECTRVQVLDRTTGALIRKEDLPASLGTVIPPVITDGDSVLVAHRRAVSGFPIASLSWYEVAADGVRAPGFEVPIGAQTVEGVTLLEDHLLLELDDAGREHFAAIPVPGVRPAMHGWLTPQGNLSGTRAVQ